MKTAVLFAYAVLYANTITAQTDSLVDVFPLAVGNQWTYSYRTTDDEYEDDVTYADSGSADYTAISSSLYPDSTVWSITEHKDVIHCVRYHFGHGGPDTCYPVQTTTTFQLIEQHQGNHRLHRNQSDYDIWRSVLPFSWNLADTTSIFRYMTVDSTGVHSFQTRANQYPLMRYDFVFRRGVGELSVNGRSLLVGNLLTTQHRLLSSIIVNVNELENGKPHRFTLFQNYPNPFNPSTTINYQITTRNQVSLKVFDVLGREVASLVNQTEDAGYKSVHWDASNVTSGVYFYQLKVGGFVETKKMSLVK